MDSEQHTTLNRRTFMKRAASMAAGAAALTAAGAAGGGALARSEGPAAASPAESAEAFPALGASYALVDIEANTTLATFGECSEIGSETGVIEQVTFDSKGGTIITKSAGELRLLDVTLRRGLSDDQQLFLWQNQVATGDMIRARRNVRIELYSYENEKLAQWTLDDAWPSDLVVGGEGGEIVLEELTLVHAKVCREIVT